MDKPTTKELLIDLEYALCAKLRPIFLAITDPKDDEDGDIQVMISCIAFTGKSIQERVGIVFKVIREYVPKILENRLVIIQTYDSTQITDLMDEIFIEPL